MRIVKQLFITLILFFLVTPGVIFCEDKTELYDFFDELFLNESEDNWMIKIENFTLSSNDFFTGYDAFLSELTDEEVSALETDDDFLNLYFENYVDQYIILIKAIEDDIFDSPEMEMYFKTAILQAVYQIYFEYLLINSDVNFEPLETEVEAYYTENWEDFVGYGLTSEQIKEYITQQLTQYNMQVWVESQIERAKESYRIQRNYDMLTDIGLE